MKFTLIYELEGHGWAIARLTFKDTNYEIANISYLSDAFESLSTAILNLINGSLEEHCVFDHEPGRTKIRFQQNDNKIFLTIYRFNTELMDEAWEKGTFKFNATMNLLRLKSQYLNIADALLKQWSLLEYKKKWGYEFPKAIYLSIKNANKSIN